MQTSGVFGGLNQALTGERRRQLKPASNPAQPMRALSQMEKQTTPRPRRRQQLTQKQPQMQNNFGKLAALTGQALRIK